MARGPLRIATRGSTLARTQAESVAAALGVDTELVIVSTTGDQRADTPIWAMGGRGVFVKEVEEAVLAGLADLAVHSAKDLPSSVPDGLVLAAFPEREDPRDAMVGGRLDDLPTGAVVATGSVRRRAQLAHLRPDLSFAPLRGNIETRLEKAAAADAGVLAYAGLVRLGLGDAAAEILEPSVMLPQVGQGALAIQCRADDDATLEVVTGLDRPDVRRGVEAERGFLGALGGGCNLPVGALAQASARGPITLEVLMASLDGRVVLRHTEVGDDPGAVGARAALVLHDERGGAALLGEGLA